MTDSTPRTRRWWRPRSRYSNRAINGSDIARARILNWIHADRQQLQKRPEPIPVPPDLGFSTHDDLAKPKAEPTKHKQTSDSPDKASIGVTLTRPESHPLSTTKDDEKTICSSATPYGASSTPWSSTTYGASNQSQFTTPNEISGRPSDPTTHGGSSPSNYTTAGISNFGGIYERLETPYAATSWSVPRAPGSPPTPFRVNPSPTKDERRQKMERLKVACVIGDNECVLGLLENVDIESILPGGQTALICAVEHGHKTLVRHLLKKGSNINRVCLVDGTGYLARETTALVTAAAYGHIALVDVLVGRGANVNLRLKSGVTALIAAAHACRDDIVTALIQRGADVDSREGSGESALSRAVCWYGARTVEVLLKHGALCDGKVIDAARGSSEDIVELLGKWGIRIDRNRRMHEDEINTLIRYPDIKNKGAKPQSEGDDRSKEGREDDMATEKEAICTTEEENIIAGWHFALPSNITLIFDGWEIYDIVRNVPKSEIRPFLEQMLTLTARGHCIEAGPCRSYLKENFGQTGLLLLEGVIGALENRYGSYRESNNPVAISVQTHSYINRFLESRYMAVAVNQQRIFIRHHKDCVDMERALRWLCLAVRLPQQDGIFLSTSRVRSESPRSFHLTPLQTFPALQEDGIQSSCWRTLFSSAVIAVEDQVPDIRDFHLELDFHVMVQLAAAEYTVRTGAGLVLLGYSTALVPIECPDNDNSVINWHFEHSADGSQLMVDDLPATKEPWFRVTDIEILKSRKAALGWSSRALVLLGSEEMPPTVTWSTRGIKPVRWQWAGVNLQLVAQSAAPIQVGGQAGAQFKRVPNTLRFSPSDNYLGFLRTSSKESLVLYDVSEKRAWLVPKLSVIHLMARVYCKAFGLNLPEMLATTESETDWGQDSFTILGSNGNFPIEEKGLITMTLRELVLGLCINLSRIHAYSPTRSEIYGYEFMDVVHSTPSAELGKTKLKKEGLPWTPLLQHIPCLFTSNLGDAIVTIRSSTATDAPCNSLAKGHDYMAASMQCIDEIAKRQGYDTATSCDRMLSASHLLTLSPSAFDSCKHGGGDHSEGDCWNDCPFLHETCRITVPWLKSPQGSNVSSRSTLPFPYKGAIVLGRRRQPLQRSHITNPLRRTIAPVTTNVNPAASVASVSGSSSTASFGLLLRIISGSPRGHKQDQQRHSHDGGRQGAAQPGQGQTMTNVTSRNPEVNHCGSATVACGIDIEGRTKAESTNKKERHTFPSFFRVRYMRFTRRANETGGALAA
ncbi:hypothetical protein FQN50_008859 [Emmonsiellopsis sp. PD_5]|nr:hypothetical protein FQN50_008859 [Emmonsiellopsis sp. PD_5]